MIELSKLRALDYTLIESILSLAYADTPSTRRKESRPVFDRFLEEILEDLGGRVDGVVEFLGSVLVEDAIETEELRR